MSTANRKSVIARQIAKRAANRLFTSGSDEFASRLVLHSAASRDLGGWCFQAVCEVIEEEAEKALKSASRSKRGRIPTRAGE